jgi:hypothetical protein
MLLKKDKKAMSTVDDVILIYFFIYIRSNFYKVWSRLKKLLQLFFFNVWT